MDDFLIECSPGISGDMLLGAFYDLGEPKEVIEQPPMIVFPIRSCVRPGFVCARRGRGFFATQRLQICGD